jgi:hypothetical protein
MARKKKLLHTWGGFDDRQLDDLKRLVVDISGKRHKLELLISGWDKMPDDFEQQVEQLREVHESLGELIENLEEERDECDE